MSTTLRCPECGRPLTDSLADGLCPVCLMDALAPAGEPAEPASSLGSRPSLPALLPIPGYTILAELARGGMGIVYRARQHSPEREVALKMLLPFSATSKESRERFKFEASTLSDLDHPGILPIYETGEHEALPWFSMKLATNGSLVERRTEFLGRWREIAELVAALADAVQYAHERGVLHRDLKPGNVLFDAAGRPFVSDFGLAKLLVSDQEFTRSQHLLGTPQYLAPEIAGASVREATVASDVYSLGAILWELLAGSPPFEAESLPGLLRKILEEEVKPVPRGRSGNGALAAVPRDLEVICRRCLEKEPERRYRTARELAEDLQRFLDGKPIQARSVSAPEKFLRWCRRKPVHAAALGLLAVVAIGSPVAAFQIEQARRDAERNRRQAEANVYVADMNLAGQAAASGDYARTLQLLRRHLPRPGDSDPRGFEWRQLRQQTEDDSELELGIHPDPVRQLTFSADGKSLASRSVDGTAKIWDIRNQRERLTVTNVSLLGGFSPDGRSLVFGTTDASVEQVDSVTGDRRARLRNAGLLVRLLADGNRVATTSPDSLLKVWNLATGQVDQSLPGAGGWGVGRGARWDLGVALTPDGNTLAAVERDGESRQAVCVWDVRSARRLKRFSSTAYSIDSLLISDDGRFVAVIYADTGRIAVWQWEQQDEPILLPPHLSGVRAAAFSTDGKSLATTAAGEALHLWALPELSLLAAYKSSQVSPWSAAFAPDGQWLVTAGHSEPIRFWNLLRRPKPEIVTRLPALLYTRNQRTRIVFSADSQWIAPATAGESAPVLAREQLNTVASLSNVTCVLRFSKDGNAAIVVAAAGSGSEAGSIARWNRLTGSITSCGIGGLNPPPRAGPAGPLTMLMAAISPDLRLAAIPWGEGDGITLFDLFTGRDVESYSAHRGLVSDLVFFQDGRRLATAGSDGTVKVWEVPSGKLLLALDGHTDGVIAIDVAPGGRYLASASADKTVRLWNLATRSEVNRYTGHRQAPLAVAFSPDLKLLAIGSADAAVTLLSVPMWQELAQFKLSISTALAPGQAVRAVAFSPDNNSLAARTSDGTLRLWRATSELEFASPK